MNKDLVHKRAILLPALLLLATSAFGKNPSRISKDIDTKSGMQDVIIQFRTDVDEGKHKKVSDRGGALNRELGSIKAAAYKLSGQSVADLSDDPDVLYISPDRPVNSMLQYATPAVGGQTAHS